MNGGTLEDFEKITPDRPLIKRKENHRNKSFR